jgi:hypothetical protein
MLARFRIQTAHGDAQVLWSARKDLQLAMSRLDQYQTMKLSQVERELSVDLRKPTAEIKLDIQKLLQQVEKRLEESSKLNGP